MLIILEIRWGNRWCADVVQGGYRDKNKSTATLVDLEPGYYAIMPLETIPQFADRLGLYYVADKCDETYVYDKTYVDVDHHIMKIEYSTFHWGDCIKSYPGHYPFIRTAKEKGICPQCYEPINVGETVDTISGGMSHVFCDQEKLALAKKYRRDIINACTGYPTKQTNN